MEVRFEENTIYFSGLLGEDTDFGKIRACFHQIGSKSARVDFSGVERANSRGIVGWFALVRDIGLLVTYVRTPVWLIEQFNMNPYFLNGSQILSFFAPFYDEFHGRHEFILLQVGKDVPVLSDYSDFSVNLEPMGRAHLEPDFECEEYFYFLSSNFGDDRRETG